ncbi:hypothetical protein FQN51_006273 [Onygenales sp. PD_10]|nr:hypothetical protein FQN51_006273 [Onygenales sp. PD_10]
MYNPLQVRQEENLQVFNQGLNTVAPAIKNSGDPERPFEVEGDTFPDFDSAGQRSCDRQFDSCQKAANEDESVEYSVKDCEGERVIRLNAHSGLVLLRQLQSSAASRTEESFCRDWQRNISISININIGIDIDINVGLGISININISIINIRIRIGIGISISININTGIGSRSVSKAGDIGVQ